MPAFLHATTLVGPQRPYLRNPRSYLSPLQPSPFRTHSTPRMQSSPSEETYDPAVDAGQNLRDELAKVSAIRQAQAERTQESLKEMSEQLSKIMAQVRVEAGMPPVAESPPPPPQAKSSAEAAARTASSVVDEDGGGAADEPYMDPQNFGYDSTPGWQVLAESYSLPENEGNVDFRIECDMHGCSIIEVRADDAPPGPGVRQKFIHAGPNFRVGYDPEAPKSFCGMVGNDQWLLALSHDEIRHFKRLILSLQKKMDRFERGDEEMPIKKPSVRRSGDGMYNMRVSKAGLDYSVEVESKLVWLQAIGQPVLGQYCIRAIFMEARQCEGRWNMECVAGLLAAVNKLGIE